MFLLAIFSNSPYWTDCFISSLTSKLSEFTKTMGLEKLIRQHGSSPFLFALANLCLGTSCLADWESQCFRIAYRLSRDSLSRDKPFVFQVCLSGREASFHGYNPFLVQKLDNVIIVIITRNEGQGLKG